MYKIQVTYFCTTNQYKPVAAIVQVPSLMTFKKNEQYWVNRAKLQIMAKRRWTSEDMEKFGYTEYKVMTVKG